MEPRFRVIAHITNPNNDQPPTPVVWCRNGTAIQTAAAVAGILAADDADIPPSLRTETSKIEVVMLTEAELNDEFADVNRLHNDIC